MNTRFDPDELRELEQRLVERLESIAPRPRVAAGERIRAAVGTTTQRHGPLAWLRTRTPEPAWSRLLAVGATAAVALAIGIGIGRSVLTTASHSPSAIPSPLASQPSHSLAPTPQTRADIYQSWQRSDLPQGTGQARGNPHDVVEFQGSLVVVGGAETGQCAGAGCVVETSAAVWRRANGVWQRLPQQPSFLAGSMESAAASSNHLLVLGSAIDTEGCAFRFCAELWLSADGQTFIPYRAPAQFTAVVAAESSFAEFLATATVASGTGSEIWRSLDGRTWERVAVGGDLASAVISKLRRVGPLLIAIGATFTPAAEGIPALWISDGGQQWTQVHSSWETSVRDVDGSGSRLVAVGARVSGGSAWTSDNGGVTWTEFPPGTDATLDQRPLGAVRAVPGGFVAVSDRYSGPGDIWTSIDGQIWYAVPAQASIRSDDFLGPMTLTANGEMVVVGVHDPGGTRTVSVWTSASPFATPSPTLPTTTEYRFWKSMTMPDPTPHTFSGEWPYAAVEFNGQLIAVGGINGSCCTGAFSADTRAVVWRRYDPITWQLEPDESVFALGHIVDVATDGHIAVAVGSLDLESKTFPGEIASVGAAWTSSDGLSWHRTTGMPFFYAVEWFRDHFYAIAQAPAQSASGVWSSSDGMTWSLVKRIDRDFLQALRATPLGLVAVGSGAGSSSIGPAIWFSSDGAHWTRTTVPGGDQEVVTDVAGSATTLMAIGLGDTGGPAVWISHDGVSWTQTVDDFMFSEARGPQLDRVVWDGESFVALGEGDVGGSTIGFRAMTSTDGVRWQLVPPAAGFSASTGQITAALRLSTGELVVLAAGKGNGAHHGTPMAWLAQR